MAEEHRGCAGRTRRRGTCLCVSPSSRPLLPSGPERSGLLWGGPVLQLSAGWGQNISSGNRVESPGFPKAPEPQGKPGCPLPFASSLQVRAPLQAQASALLTHQGRRGFRKQWPLRCGPAQVCVCALPRLVSGPTYCVTWPGVLLASRPVTAPSLLGPRLGRDLTTEVWLFKNEI